MIGIVTLALAHFANGDVAAGQLTLDSMPPGARWQLDLRFGEVAAVCRHRLVVASHRRPGNRLVVEHVAPLPRCVQQAPDGRGAAWLASGGEVAVYGACCLANCPLGRMTQHGRHDVSQL